MIRPVFVIESNANTGNNITAAQSQEGEIGLFLRQLWSSNNIQRDRKEEEDEDDDDNDVEW